VLFENKNIFFILKKNALAYYNEGVVVESSEVVGLAPDFVRTFLALSDRQRKHFCGSCKQRFKG
jgi:hypothetical protein